MPWAIYTPSTHPFEVSRLCGSAEECKTPKRSFPIHPSAKWLIHRLANALCVLSARPILKLSECKVCQPCEVILELIKLYKVCLKPWGLSGSPTIVFNPLALCGVARTLCAWDVETPFLCGEPP
jgi:hypothetical protein